MYGIFPIDMDAVGRLLGLTFLPADLVHEAVGGDPVSEALVVAYLEHRVVLLPKTLPGRSFFNAAHEAGHVALGHFDSYDIPWLRENQHRSRLAGHTLAALDREADVFATELLMPLAVVERLRLRAEDLQFYHCVSRSAALGRLRDLQDPEWQELTRPTASSVLHHCRHYIDLIEILREAG
ncbi:MAG: ImmA/IrrE family metallo-endopeptidase [Moorellales bacterium]